MIDWLLKRWGVVRPDRPEAEAEAHRALIYDMIEDSGATREDLAQLLAVVTEGFEYHLDSEPGVILRKGLALLKAKRKG